MAIVTIISSTIDKCVSCKHYDISSGSWLSGTCLSKTTKVKSKLRWHNSKACSSYLMITQDEMNKKFRI